MCVKWYIEISQIIHQSKTPPVPIRPALTLALGEASARLERVGTCCPVAGRIPPKSPSETAQLYL